nr:arginine deiminase family protein [Marivita sp. S6314]
MAEDDGGIADAVFTYDASLVTPAGAILMSPGKVLRAGEQHLHRAFYDAHDIPIVGAITGTGRAEAGDTLWLDDETLIIGRGFRTNTVGAGQIRDIMADLKIDTHVFDLPVYTGAEACLHLMSLISLVDTKTALVCMPLLPVGLLELLNDKGFDLIEAPFAEFEQSGALSTNVLATAPGECIMLDGLPETHAALVDAGINVRLFRGDALCIGCEGGPTCLTRPLLREPIAV